MSTPVVLSLVVLFAVLIGAYLMFSKKSEIQAPTENNSSSQNGEPAALPEDKQKEYDRGMHPLAAEDLTFYTLIHCVHCVRLEKFMHENEIPYSTVLLDNFDGAHRRNLMEVLRSYNPRGSFPTLVSPEGEVTVGFREWQVREKFMKYSLREDLRAESVKNNSDNSDATAEVVSDK